MQVFVPSLTGGGEEGRKNREQKKTQTKIASKLQNYPCEDLRCCVVAGYLFEGGGGGKAQETHERPRGLLSSFLDKH